MKNWSSRFIATATVISLLVFVEPANAFMSSDSFRVWTDTITSGGNRSTSASFITQDTISESATGENLTSATFLAQAGLPAIFEEPVLTMAISSATLSLTPSTFDVGSVSTGSYTVTVSTNAPFGYTLTVTEDAGLQNTQQAGTFIGDVADGVVTAGSSEYGVAVTGTDAAFADDRALSTTPLTIASRTSLTSGIVSTITHKVAISSGVSAGTYTHTVTYVAIANY